MERSCSGKKCLWIYRDTKMSVIVRFEWRALGGGHTIFRNGEACKTRRRSQAVRARAARSAKAAFTIPQRASRAREKKVCP